MVMTPDWKYCITLYRADWPTIEQWCVANLGDFDDTWYKLGIDIAQQVVDGRVKTIWYFKQNHYAVLFALKWS